MLATPIKKKRFIKLSSPPPKPAPSPPVTPPVPSTTLVQAPVIKKRIIKLKVLVPPPPKPGVYVTKAMEAFEAIREYYALRNQVVPQEDIKWFQEELVREKKEFDEFWERCIVTKTVSECVFRGDDEWTIQLAENAAKQKEKALPVQESDIGPMPEYGSKDFWAWCHKRKKLKEQKEASIIAAGGKVPVKKISKKVVKKASTQGT